MRTRKLTSPRSVPRTIVCPVCKNTFAPTVHQRYCYRWGITERMFCSTVCYHKSNVGSGNPKWRGGKTIADDYIYVYCPEHPQATNKGYVAEHRLVIEKSIGRLLAPTEVVHHINDNPKDNRLENLMLLKDEAEHRRLHAKYRTRNHKGQFSGHKKNVSLLI